MVDLTMFVSSGPTNVVPMVVTKVVAGDFATIVVPRVVTSTNVVSGNSSANVVPMVVPAKIIVVSSNSDVVVVRNVVSGSSYGSTTVVPTVVSIMVAMRVAMLVCRTFTGRAVVRGFSVVPIV